MTERKPAGISWETWIDRQIREGMDRGEFDGLPGHGQPLPDVGQARDELWWVRSKLQREGVSFLPPTLAVRKDLDDARERIAVAPSEAQVREIVEGINAKIRAVNAQATSGPPSNLMPLDIERVVTEWAGSRPH